MVLNEIGIPMESNLTVGNQEQKYCNTSTRARRPQFVNRRCVQFNKQNGNKKKILPHPKQILAHNCLKGLCKQERIGTTTVFQHSNSKATYVCQHSNNGATCAIQCTSGAREKSQTMPIAIWMSDCRDQHTAAKVATVPKKQIQVHNMDNTDNTSVQMRIVAAFNSTKRCKFSIL